MIKKNLPLSSQMGATMVLLASVLWGTTGTLQAFAPSGTSPLALGEIRISLGGFFLLLFVLYREGIDSLRGYWPVGGILISALGMAGFQLCFFAAVLRTGVAVGTMVTIGSSPVVAGILGWLFLGEILTARWKMTTFMAIAGCCLLAAGNGGIKIEYAGIALALMAGFCYALLGLGMKRVEGTHSPLAVISVIMLTGALMASPVYFMAPMNWFLSIRGLSISIMLGLFSTAVAYGFFSFGLTSIPISTAYTLTLGEPLTATLLGVLLLGESLSVSGFVGIVLIFSGIALLSLNGSRVN